MPNGNKMEKVEIKHFKVLQLPISAEKNSIYYVLDSERNKVKTYITDNSGIPIPLIDLKGEGIVESVTGTAVTGAITNPEINIVNLLSSELGNLVKLSSVDGKLKVNRITSPDLSLEVVNSENELQLQIASGLIEKINNALQPEDITQYTDEGAQDAVGNILVDSNTIDLVYNDTTPQISASVKQNSITNNELSSSVNNSLNLANTSLQPVAIQNFFNKIVDDTDDIVEGTIKKFTTISEKNFWNNKQPLLVSGTNIKTINGNSLLGSGNVEVTADISGKEDISNKQNSLAVDGTGVKFPTVDAVNNEVVKLSGDQTILGLKILESFGGVANLTLMNNNSSNRDNYLRFQNPSGLWDLGLKGNFSTLFELKYGDIPYYSVERFTGNTSIGYNAPTNQNTLFMQDLQGSTNLVIKEGFSQGTSDLLNIKDWSGNNILRVNHQGSLERRKNLNRLFIFSGDSWSNDVVENVEAGDWPTYFLQRGYLAGESNYLVTAVGGRQVATMLANYATEIRPFSKSKIEQERTIFILGGINDLFGNRSATDIYNDLKSMWLNARNDGFNVIAFTVCPSVDLTQTKETQRLALNDLILSDRTLYDFLIRTEILFPNASDTNYFNVDGVHLNSLGAKILGNAVYDYVYTDKYMFSVEPTQPASEGSGTKLIPNSVIDDLTLTGTPTAPTPTAESVGMQIANKDYVINSLSTKISGSGTTNFLPKFTGSGTIGDSSLFESPSGVIGIGTTTPSPYFGKTIEIAGANGGSLVLKGSSVEAVLFTNNGGGFAAFGTNTNHPLDVTVNGLSKARFHTDNSLTINTIANNGQGTLQVNGNITASPATLSNQVVVKSQLDTKQNTITGTANVIPKFGTGGLVETFASENNGIKYLTGSDSEDISYGIGKSFSSGNSVFFGWRYRGGTPYGFIETFASTAPFSIQSGGGRTLVGTTVDDMSNTLQVNGNITASPATLSNQVVVKSQLDLKADLASPSLTGTPTAPTAPAGTNTAQIATAAFVNNNIRSRQGWASYSTTTYTNASPFTVTPNSTVTLLNNANNSIITDLPSGVTAFYNGTTNKITPIAIGDSYTVNVRFKARTTMNNDYLSLFIDIGAGTQINAEAKQFLKGANTEQPFSFTMPIFTLATFVANGGEIKISSNEGTISVYDITYFIIRNYTR